MKLSFEIRELLKNKSGKELIEPSDCDFIVLDIYNVTHERIGINTLKRMLGFIDDERNPRISTLNIIAKYLGYSNWETLSKAELSNSTFDKIDGELDLESLCIGQKIELSYLPNRTLKIKYLGEYRFIVISSINSKLQTGDCFEARHLMLNYPLIASEVMRQGQCLGQLKAGNISGLTSIKLLS